MGEPIRAYSTFWRFYLSQHSRPLTRALHLTGTILGLGLLVTAAAARDARYLLAAPIVGYSFAWGGHFFVERNQPATFRYPLWSLLSDFRMLGFAISFRLERELRRQGVPSR